MALQDQMRQHVLSIRQKKDRLSEAKARVSNCARDACSGGSHEFLCVLASRLGQLNDLWMECHQDPYDVRGGVKIIRGSARGGSGIPWPADAGYTTKLEAMQDPRSIFDCLREAFFLTKRYDGKPLC